MSKTPSLTAVLHAVVKAAPSGISATTIANLLENPERPGTVKGYQTLMSELSRQPGHKLGADLVLPIMDLANSDEPLHFLARQRGGVFVKLPRVTGDGGPVQLAALKAVEEFGHLMAEVGADLADGKISREECDRITKEGQDAVTAIMSLLQLVGEIGRAHR